MLVSAVVLGISKEEGYLLKVLQIRRYSFWLSVKMLVESLSHSVFGDVSCCHGQWCLGLVLNMCLALLDIFGIDGIYPGLVS